MIRLKQLRTERKKTQEEISELIGITRAAYSNIETGKRETDFRTLNILANYFDVSIDFLIGRTDTNEKKPTTANGDGQDKALIDWWHSLPPETRKAILTLGDGPKELT